MESSIAAVEVVDCCCVSYHGRDLVLDCCMVADCCLSVQQCVDSLYWVLWQPKPYQPGIFLCVSDLVSCLLTGDLLQVAALMMLSYFALRLLSMYVTRVRSEIGASTLDIRSASDLSSEQ